jgi:Ca2+/Na+ antiporter
MMAGLAIAPLAYGLFAGFGFVGWRLAAWLAALPMAYYGLMSIAFPLQAGSTGAVWGAAAVLWAIAFVAVAEYSRLGGSTTLRREVPQSN